jgi:2-methylisocitrate lyase-like PEP mutase family enzyme
MDKGTTFRDLHARDGAFVVANAWDAGSARLFASLGFEALATTSAGLSYVLGRRDGAATRDQTLESTRAIVDATDRPVSADLENGFGDAPETVAETIRRAAAIGLAGGSIEDATGDPARPLYDFGHAVERVAAAVEAARAQPTPFVLTARAEGLLFPQPDLDDVIRRLQAFEAAGAEVLFAPSAPDLDTLRRICGAVSRPVNVFAGPGVTLRALADAGARRVSVGSSLARAALGAAQRAAREILNAGSFSYARESVPYDEANALMLEPTSEPRS